jgi:hypothetical protein
LEAAYPLALADLAFGFASGTVSLSRCTVLGPTAVHRMAASECILHDIARVEDPQHGCVRFSAYAQGSNLHAPYRSVAIPPRGPLFESRLFGRPEYAKLRRDADNAIVAPQPGDTILGGAADGNEASRIASEAFPPLGGNRRDGFTLSLLGDRSSSARLRRCACGGDSRIDADVGACGEMRFACAHRRDARRDLSRPRRRPPRPQGLIRRGVADRISDVLWYSDLREFTRITDQSPPEQIIPLLTTMRRR